MQKVGAYSEEKKATEEVQHICDQVCSPFFMQHCTHCISNEFQIFH